MCVSCVYRRWQEQTCFEASDYIPASAWGKVDQPAYAMCAKTGWPCGTDEEPAGCPLQEQTSKYCPWCLVDEEEHEYLTRNGLGILHCPHGHQFTAAEYKSAAREAEHETAC